MAEATRTLNHDERILRGVSTRPLDLSIAIVTWNSERWIARCLQSIAANFVSGFAESSFPVFASRTKKKPFFGTVIATCRFSPSIMRSAITM